MNEAEQQSAGCKLPVPCAPRLARASVLHLLTPTNMRCSSGCAAECLLTYTYAELQTMPLAMLDITRVSRARTFSVAGWGASPITTAELRLAVLLYS